MFLSSLCSLLSRVPISTDQTLILPNSNGIFLTFLLFTYLGVRTRSHLSVGNDNQFHCLLSVTFQSSNLQNSSFWNGDALRDGLQDYSLRLRTLFICSFNCYNIVYFVSSFWTLHSYRNHCFASCCPKIWIWIKICSSQDAADQKIYRPCKTSQIWTVKLKI